MTRQASPLPHWPALMSIDVAADYWGMSEASFRVLARKLDVHPIDAAPLALLRWAKADLDAAVDRMARRGVVIPPQGAGANVAGPDELAQAALRRAEKRARGR